MMTPNAIRGHGHTGAVRKGQEFPRPARYDKASTTRGRVRKSVPLVIDGITHYSTAEAAERLGLAAQTVKNLIANGTLAYRVINPRLNMVPEPALDDYARNHRHRRGRPQGSRNKAKDAPTAPADNPSAEGEECDQ